MTLGWAVLAAGSLLAQGPPTPMASLPSLAVFNLAAEGVDTTLARLVTDQVVAETHRSADVSRILASSDLEALLGLERQKQLLSCSEDSCMAELAGALGTDLLLVGSVGALGGTHVVNLKLLDVRRALTLAVVNQRTPSLAALADMTTQATFELLKQGHRLKAGVRAPSPSTAVAADGQAAGPGMTARLPWMVGGGALGALAVPAVPVGLVLLGCAVALVVVPYLIVPVPTPGLPPAARRGVFPLASLSVGAVSGLAAVVGLVVGVTGAALVAWGLLH